jgi:hypothetical protein
MNINRNDCLKACEIEGSADNYKHAIYLKATFLYGTGESIEDIAHKLSLAPWQVSRMINAILDRCGL